mmetsp:Transcript_59293/g.105407  ORF Transcript_59293/g.105407 Transcript_59293/m.105407 type:complete len:288 (+) Transcript_59293:937-1800(+)
MAIQHTEVDTKLLKRFVADVAVLEGLLQPRPTLSVDSETQRLRCDMVAPLLLLERLRSCMDRQGLPISTKHEDFQSTGAVVLISWLVSDLGPFFQVDRIRRCAPNNELSVDEEAFSDIATFFFAIGHDEAKTLLRIPLVHPALLSKVLRFFFFLWWLNLYSDLLRWPRRIFLASLCLTALIVERHELCLRNGFSHLLRLLHFPHSRVLVIFDLSEGLAIFFWHVVDTRLVVVIETGFRMELPLASLFVYVPATAIPSWLVIAEVSGRHSLRRAGRSSAVAPGWGPRL